MEDITDINDFRLFGRRPAESKQLFESLFATLCQRFTYESGKNTLMPSPSLYEAKQLLPLKVVTMKKKRNMFASVKEYSTYDISLANLLIGQPVLELQVDESKHCLNKSYTCNSYSLKWKIGGSIFDLIVGSLSFFFDISITCKLGNLIEQRIEYSSFMSALKERKLDMNHHFIREIKDSNQVLCVIRGVITTSDKAEIKCTNKKGSNINLSEKVSSFFRVHINAIEEIASSVEDMVIEPRTTLAYDVWELRVNVDSGEITPFMMAHNNGGFLKSADMEKKKKLSLERCDSMKADMEKKEKHSLETYHCIKETRQIEKYTLEKYHCIKETQKIEKYTLEKCHGIKDQQKMQSNVNRSDKPNEGYPHPPNDDTRKMKKDSLQKYQCIKDKVEKAAKPQYLKVILHPLRRRLKFLLLILMRCYSDIVAISKILSKAEDSCLDEDKDTIDKQFINKETVWSILEFVGVQTEEGRVLYKKEATPKLIALVYMIDALLELENDDIDMICHCDEPQLKTLSKILESAVASSMPIPIDVDMSSVLKEPVSSFLTHKKFIVCNDSIQPPKAKTSNVDCIFCVLYCLS